VQGVQDFSFISRATSGKETHFGHLCNFSNFVINSKSRTILMQIHSYPKFLAVTKLIATSNFMPKEERELCLCHYKQSNPNIFTSVVFYRGVVHKTS